MPRNLLTVALAAGKLVVVPMTSPFSMRAVGPTPDDLGEEGLLAEARQKKTRQPRI